VQNIKSLLGILPASRFAPDLRIGRRLRFWELSQDLLVVCDFQVITAVNPAVTRILG